MDRIKCTCGHANPPGTTICESCAKPLEGKGQELLNMRYEGVARRSQLKPKGFFDQFIWRIWSFFSSVKIAVWMILITLLASIIGTILPQEEFKRSNLPAEQYYPQSYGAFGEFYYKMGFHQLYSSWWFILLLLMIGISLVICSIDRVIPLYRALQKQRIPKNLEFYRRQRFYLESVTDSGAVDRLESELKKKKYKIKRNEDGLLAEKARFSRWGPYVNHIGLILFILAVLLRLIPGFYYEGFVWVWDGETKKVPGTHLYIKNEKFTLEIYDEKDFKQEIEVDGAVIKNYQTDAILYEMVEGELVEVHRGDIRVNHPLKYKGILLYQQQYQLQQLYEYDLSLIEKESREQIATFRINLHDPPETIDLGNGYQIKVLNYFPDFDLDKENKPYTKSRTPNLPAFVFKVIGPDLPEGENSWLITGMDMDSLSPQNKYSIGFNGAQFKNKTGLSVMIDRGLPVVWIASFIVVIGLAMGFYWQHRRIWLREEDGKLYLAAHTNKNWYSLRKEIEGIVQGSELNLPMDLIDKGGKPR